MLTSFTATNSARQPNHEKPASTVASSSIEDVHAPYASATRGERIEFPFASDAVRPIIGDRSNPVGRGSADENMASHGPVEPRVERNSFHFYQLESFAFRLEPCLSQHKQKQRLRPPLRCVMETGNEDLERLAGRQTTSRLNVGRYLSRSSPRRFRSQGPK